MGVWGGSTARVWGGRHGAGVEREARCGCGEGGTVRVWRGVTNLTERTTHSVGLVGSQHGMRSTKCGQNVDKMWSQKETGGVGSNHMPVR